MKPIFPVIIFLAALVFSACSSADKSTNDDEYTAALEYCKTQAEKTIAGLKDQQRIPRSVASGKTEWRTVNYRDWTSGFWPGILWYVYQYSKDEKIKAQADAFCKALTPLLDSSAIDHDLGFVMYNSFGNGWRLTQNPAYKNTLLRAADSLATLFNPKVGTILSWPRSVPGADWPLRHNTIMDNMIN